MQPVQPVQPVQPTICPQCGAHVPSNARFCLLCGHANPNFVDNSQTSDTGELFTPGPAPAPQMGGAVTVNISAPDPPAAAQPRQYNPAPASVGPPTTPPQQYYSPPPSYGQTRNFQPGGAQPPAPYTNYSQTPIGYQYQPVGTGSVQSRDPILALLLELIGYVGFLGIGHIYAGRTGRGIALMVGWWIYLAISWALTSVFIGCVLLLISLAVPVASGLWIKSELAKEQAAMRPY